MFFIFGITSKRDDLDFGETRICSVCGRYGRYNVFVGYNALSLFFIPVFKWGKKYFMEASCCGSLFSLSEEIGRDIESGRNVSVGDEDLTPIYTNNSRMLNCSSCGYSVEQDHTFCPNCGNKL